MNSSEVTKLINQRHEALVKRAREANEDLIKAQAAVYVAKTELEAFQALTNGTLSTLHDSHSISVLDAETSTCQYCHEVKHKRGLKPHEKHCPQNPNKYKHKFSAKTRQAMSLAMKQRWARLKKTA